ncbi:SCO family protein [Pseudomonas sp. HR96]|uniref:SCO family protein n=1 Tax=Pseudomonas sp. HR96 TaxID=1027966 RepID=UPI002A7523EB|nr:SCO family protein [Pseudomonas sp. HR96]WPO99888.1 SCO family protein [Pseudomonas sp. HR96]
MNRTQKIVFTLAAILMVGVGACLWLLLSSRSPAQTPAMTEAGVLLMKEPRGVPAVSMSDQDGSQVRLDKLTGHWTLVFFGYTFCPDICPTTLAQLRQIDSRLPAASRARLKVVFVSVDPQRDSPGQLKQYLGYFDPAFTGLVGTPESLEQLANGLSIPYIAPDTRQPNYSVQHSGNMALLGPDGTQRGLIRAPFNTEKVLAVLPGLLSGN